MKATKRIISMLVVALMICAMLPTTAFAAEAGHTFTIKIAKVYRYTMGNQEVKEITVPCTYSTNHNTNCNFTISTVAHPDTLGWGTKGWIGWASDATGTWTANPSQINSTFYTFQSVSAYAMTNSAGTESSTTIYMIYEDPTPDVTYTLSYDANGGTGAPAAQSETNNTGSATFTIPATTPAKEGFTFKNWAGNGSTYAPGAQITITANTTLTASWEEIPHEHADANDDGICDGCQEAYCTHEKDSDGYCTVENCTHPETCCTKAPAHEHTDADDDGSCDDCQEAYCTHEKDSDGYCTVENCAHPETCCSKAPAHEHTDADVDGICDDCEACLHSKNEDGSCAVEGCAHPETCCPKAETEEPDTEKVSEPGMDKKNGTQDTLGTVAPGTVFNFTLNSHIGQDLTDAVTAHKNGDYEGTYVLTFHDTMKNLTFVDNSLSVKVGETTLNDTQYTVSLETDDNCTFHVVIDCVALLNANVFNIEDAGEIPVVVAYQAKVAEDAKDNTEISNSASVNDSLVDVLAGDVDDTIPTPPSTGGTGTKMYTIMGIGIMVIAAAMYIANQKKKGSRA